MADSTIKLPVNVTINADGTHQFTTEDKRIPADMTLAEAEGALGGIKNEMSATKKAAGPQAKAVSAALAPLQAVVTAADGVIKGIKEAEKEAANFAKLADLEKTFAAVVDQASTDIRPQVQAELAAEAENVRGMLKSLEAMEATQAEFVAQQRAELAKIMDSNPLDALKALSGKILEINRASDLATRSGDFSREEDLTFDTSKKTLGSGKGALENDVPTSVGGEYYEYEAKRLSVMKYGEKPKQREQAAKYQDAIKDGKIAGATVEIRGRIDADTLDSIIKTGTYRDLQFIIDVPLPSGKEFRTELKPGRHTVPAGDHKEFEDAKDRAVAQGLRNAINIARDSGDTEPLKEALSNEFAYSPTLQARMDGERAAYEAKKKPDPFSATNITDPATYLLYRNEMRETQMAKLAELGTLQTGTSVQTGQDVSVAGPETDRKVS